MTTLKTKEDWIKITTPNFYYSAEKSVNVSRKLQSEAPLVITGRYIPRQSGLKKLIASLTYREAKQPVHCETQTIQVKKELPQEKSVPGVILITNEGHSLIGRLSSTAPEDGPSFPVNEGRLAWNPDTKDLVCLGRNGKGVVYNLKKKTKLDSFELEGSNHILKVKWNSDKNHFIAVGDRGSIYLSEDAKQWQKQKGPVLARLTDISWSATLQIYVAVGDEGTLITSSDGKAWEIQKCELEKGPLKYDLICIERSDELDRFVVLHKNSDYKNKRSGVLTSTGGLNWEYHPEVIPSGPRWRSMAWSPSNKRFVTVGDDRSIISSNEGLKWSGNQLNQRNIFAGSPNFDFTEVIYNSWINAFVAVGSDFTAYYSYSGDTVEKINREWKNLTASKWTLKWSGYSHYFMNVSECNYYV